MFVTVDINLDILFMHFHWKFCKNVPFHLWSRLYKQTADTVWQKKMFHEAKETHVQFLASVFLSFV